MCSGIKNTFQIRTKRLEFTLDAIASGRNCLNCGGGIEMRVKNLEFLSRFLIVFQPYLFSTSLWFAFRFFGFSINFDVF